MELLSKGMEQSKIPNLIYRSPSKIISNKVSYFVDRRTLSRISFSDITCLYDYELYLEAINKKLGFPVLLGGAVYSIVIIAAGAAARLDCTAPESKLAVRSIDAVIKDLKRLKGFTKKIYLCYEIDPDYIKTLFQAIGEEETLIKAFQLNYGAWQLFDREFITTYGDLFISSPGSKPVFELSPEVFDEASRKKIKHRAKYSMRELKENLTLINAHLGGRNQCFDIFSRYHDAIKTYADMKKEIYAYFA